MKALKRISMRSVSEVLSDKEMRLYVGGYVDGSGTYDDPYQLPEVVVTGYGTDCGLQYGGCTGTSAKEGDPCDYVWTNGDGVRFRFTGTCEGNGYQYNPVMNLGWPSVYLTCWGGSSGVRC